MIASFESGYRAIVIGASGGIGAALLARLKADPRCALALPLSRSRDASELHDPPVQCHVA
ncbi:hypothetical protein O9X99_22360 [Agrobacterium salinitolerans]|uniref:Short-chain dehydrogenase n=1 Tax=Agrobacterium salinitolerans TaxID=1183413 RepID=A0A9X3R1K7_9HYPH|nr:MULTISPECIES: hypothetical protein [Agrobacterium]MCZ7852671.1 hypothetical protein [Agrobacterium salinitolerans]MCZ7894414.1 hypothetical protein [Agrobacterium salinitolerans]MCZ7940402.1 hypothetical protein [Agrobacterium salinitolerans]MCZ7977461.1 hypothetical protein [Agrobacterium salinitolerans]